MSIVTKENLKAENISRRVISLIEKFDSEAQSKKKHSLKIKLNGHYTGCNVFVSNSFLYNEKLKSDFVLKAEELLNREVKIGTMHVYVGRKLC